MLIKTFSVMLLLHNLKLYKLSNANKTAAVPIGAPTAKKGEFFEDFIAFFLLYLTWSGWGAYVPVALPGFLLIRRKQDRKI